MNRTGAIIGSLIGLTLFALSLSFAQHLDRSDAGERESQLRKKVSSGAFARLYSNTYYNILGRIEEDGFFRESNDPLKGYDGMYPRTVGALVSLLLAVDRPDPGERLIRCVLEAMKSDGLNRIPHAFDKKRGGILSTAGRYVILGRGDQLDGQAHIIMAWARLANYRGRTFFEDSTYSIIAALLNSSTRPPYCSDTSSGKIPELMFNPYFEHSRTGGVQWRYDLLTQCFVGAALSEMIPVAERRNDPANARGWKERLRILKDAIAEHFIVRRDGKQVFVELLLADSNKVFEGMGWVNMAPVAAQWNPFGAAVMGNTLRYMRGYLMKERDGYNWLPTDSWPGNGFSPQIIGKGVGWELEFASSEKNWKRVSEIVDLVEYLHPESRIYMENAFLRTGDGKALPIQYSDSGSAYRSSSWALADPGNGEQVSWWCWAVANLRKRLGLSALPEPVASAPRLDSTRTTDTEIFFVEEPGTSIYYTLEPTALVEQFRRYHGRIGVNRPARLSAYAQQKGMLQSSLLTLDLLAPDNGLRYTYSTIGDAVLGACLPPVVMRTGVVRKIGFPSLALRKGQNLVKCEGVIALQRAGVYRFRIRSSEQTQLLIDGTEIATSAGAADSKKMRLGKGFHEFAYIATNVRGEGQIEIKYSMDGKAYASVLPEMLFQRKRSGKFVEMPEILTGKSEFEQGDTLTVRILSTNPQSSIFYTTNGANVTEDSRAYAGPFTVTKTTTVKAVARTDDGGQSAQAVGRYEAVPRKVKISLKPEPSARYAAQGGAALVDGVRGTMDLSDNRWLGFQGTHLEADLDLGTSKRVEKVIVGCLHNPDSWIFLPKRLHLSVSDDGNTFKEVSVQDVAPTAMEKPEIRSVALLNAPVECRFLKIRAESYGILPSWHKAAGRDSWLFLDEIEIR